MTTEQVLVRLPESLARRFRQAAPSRERSAFVQRLLEEALPSLEGDEDPLYRAALDVEQDTALAAEMAEWEGATLGDGLDRADQPDRPRSNRVVGVGYPPWIDLVG